MKTLNYQNHIEFSEGGTKLISSCLCPLNQDEIQKNQLFSNSNGIDTVMCVVEGQELKDGTQGTFQCPHFFGAIYPYRTNIVDCRNPKLHESFKNK